MKKVFLNILFVVGLTATAQVKIGNDVTNLALNVNFQVEGTAAENQFVVLKSGNVGIGLKEPNERLQIVGLNGSSGLKLSSIPDATLGTSADGTIIDIGKSPDVGVAVTKKITQVAVAEVNISLQPAGTYNQQPTIFDSQNGILSFRMRSSAVGGNLRLYVCLIGPPTVSVDVRSTRVNYGDGTSTTETDNRNFTSSNWNVYQLVSEITNNNRSSLTNIYTESGDSNYDNKYFTVNLTKGNGGSNTTGPMKAMIINKY